MPTNDIKYVGLNSQQMNFGKKTLLYSEMEILNVIKNYKNYLKLRKQEFSLKNLLKKTISELKKELKNLDTLLPEVPEEKNSLGVNKGKQSHESLEAEIEEIKRKIAELS